VAAAAAIAGACVLAGAVAAGVLGGGAVAGLLAEGVRPAALNWWLAGVIPHPVSATVAVVTIQAARRIRRRA
jgi:hypothetical protein